MKIYRLEHKETNLGPFQHGGQITEVILDGIHATKKAMDDLDDIAKVKKLFKIHKKDIKFGFTNKKSFMKMIRSNDVLEKHGFNIVVVQADPLFVSDDKQVLYLESGVKDKKIIKLF